MKRIFPLVLCMLLVCSVGWCTTQQVIGSGTDTFGATSTTNTEYKALVIDDQAGAITTPAQTYAVVAADGAFSSLRVELEGDPGAGNSWTFSIYVDGSATSVTCTISNAETNCTDLVNSVAVTAGQLINIQIDPDSTPDAPSSGAGLSVMWTPDTDNETIFLGSDPADHGSGLTDGNWIMPFGNCYDDSNEIDRQLFFPTDGTLKDMYFELDTDLAAGEVATFTVYKNTIATSLTCTITGAGGTEVDCNDTSNDVDIAAGDLVAVLVSITNGPFAGEFTSWGFVFVPDVNGEFILPMTTDNAFNATDTRFVSLISDSAPITNENNRAAPMSAFTVKNMYTKLAVDPGAVTEIVTFTLQDDGGDASGTFFCAINGDTADFECIDTETVVIAAGSLLATEIVPTSSPAVGGSYVSYLGFIEPTGVEDTDGDFFQFLTKEEAEEIYREAKCKRTAISCPLAFTCCVDDNNCSIDGCIDPSTRDDRVQIFMQHELEWDLQSWARTSWPKRLMAHGYLKKQFLALN